MVYCRRKDGECSEGPQHLLRQVQQAPENEGDSVQEVGWEQAGPGKAALRPQAGWLRRPVQAHPEEEGQNDQEAGAEDRVQRLQVEAPDSH